MLKRLLLVLALALAPALAVAQMPLLNVGPGGFSTAPVYATGGVYIPADAWIGTNSTLNVTNSKTFYLEFWQMANQSLTAPSSVLTNIVNSVSYASRANSWCEVTAGTAPGMCISFDSTAGNFASFNANNSTGVTAATDASRFNGDGVQADVIPIALWNFYQFSCDSTASTSAQRCAVAVNGVNMLPTPWSTVNAMPLNLTPDLNTGGVHLINGMTVNVANRSAYMSDMVMTSQQAFLCTAANTPATMPGIGTVTCPSGGVFPAEWLAYRSASAAGAKGTSRLPKDPGTNCANLGVTPGLCLLAGATPTTGMVTNQGNATPGVAIAANAVVTGGGIFPAPFGPNGIPDHQATMRWIMTDRAPVTVGSTNKTITTNAYGSPIQDGDLIIIAAALEYSVAGNPTGGACPGNTAFNTWVDLGTMQDTAGNLASYKVCYAFVHTGDLGGAWSITWSTSPGGTVRTSMYAMLDYTNVASVDQTGTLFTTAATSYNTASKTTTAANETLVSMWLNAQANDAGSPFVFPAGVNGRNRTDRGGIFPQFVIGDEYALASGSNTQRTATRLGGAGTDNAWGVTISLVPN